MAMKPLNTILAALALAVGAATPAAADWKDMRLLTARPLRLRGLGSTR